MPDWNRTYGVGPGYRDVVTVDLTSGDYTAPNGACHVYAAGTAGQTVAYRTLGGTADQTYTIPTGGTGVIRMGDSLPVMIAIVRQTGTNATTVQAGLLL